MLFSKNEKEKAASALHIHDLLLDRGYNRSGGAERRRSCYLYLILIPSKRRQGSKVHELQLNTTIRRVL